ncbi:MAG: MFS transporter [Nitrospirota bacterium]
MDNKRRTAFQFIILLGIVSLFGDITYEAARSVTGPYLSVLGASAFIVGLVAGLGEFLGYALRLASGYIADRTRAYWPITIIGYGLILSIPMLAFAGYWQVAAFLIICERVGKAIRTPARDAMLSHATKQVGRGWGFGIHEALDQVGAIVGPLIFSAVFFLKGDYQDGFAILWIPAFLTLAILLMVRKKVPSPQKLETSEKEHTDENSRLPKIFWLYALFIFLSVAGFANFQIISYHFKVKSIVTDAQIPLLYAIAMGVDGLAALIIGKAYDKIGLKVLITIPLLTIAIPIFAFSYNYSFAVTGVLLWGTVMGIHETIMRAAIADLIPTGRRGFVYGVFNIIYGISWLIGSTLMGLLYTIDPFLIMPFVIFMELISIPVFLAVYRRK